MNDHEAKARQERANKEANLFLLASLGVPLAVVIVALIMEYLLQHFGS